MTNAAILYPDEPASNTAEMRRWYTRILKKLVREVVGETYVTDYGQDDSLRDSLSRHQETFRKDKLWLAERETVDAARVRFLKASADLEFGQDRKYIYIHDQWHTLDEIAHKQTMCFRELGDNVPQDFHPRTGDMCPACTNETNRITEAMKGSHNASSGSNVRFYPG